MQVKKRGGVKHKGADCGRGAGVWNAVGVDMVGENGVRGVVRGCVDA